MCKLAIDNGKHYLYRHIRLDKNEPFYIGVGTKMRKGEQYYRANSVGSRNEIWASIYNRTEIQVDILYESDDVDFILKKEKEFILLYGRITKGTGCLANMDDGGGGHHKTVYVRTESHKRKSAEQCLINAANNKGGSHFNSNAREVYVYTWKGDLLWGFGSASLAASFIGDGATIHRILKKLDTGRSYLNYFFSSIRKENIDVSNFTLCPIGKDYSPKKVAKLNADGSIEKVYDTIKMAALDIGIHEDSLRSNIRLKRRTKAGNFKLLKDVNQ